MHSAKWLVVLGRAWFLAVKTMLNHWIVDLLSIPRLFQLCMMHGWKIDEDEEKEDDIVKSIIPNLVNG